MTRAFVALVPPDDVLDAIATATASLDVAELRRTKRDQWHVTLQFLGNHADVDAVAVALRSVTAVPASVRIGGAGAFPSERRARVLWLGIEDRSAWVTALAASVGAGLEPLGFARETRPFHPHLTLARARSRPVDVGPVVRTLRAQSFGAAWTASEIVCYESRTLPSGAQYVPRAVITLRA